MSGARLCTLLADLGYDSWQMLDPDSYEWPFQYEETRPLLDWLCTNLRTSNVLTVPELHHYTQLLSQGKLLQGEDLDFAYGSISAFESKRSTQEAVLGAEESLKEIREGTHCLKEEASALQRRVQLLQAHMDSLTAYTSSLMQGRRARVAVASAAGNQMMVAEEKLASRNLEMNTVLDKLASSARELAHYHSGEEQGIFLSFADLGHFLVQDQACTKQLNEWFVKQFDVGPSRLVAEEGKSKCSWVTLDDLVTQGDSEKSHHRRVLELQRLRSIFGISERQWIDAQVEKAKQLAVLATVKLQASADQAYVHSDLHSLRRRNADVGSELHPLVLKEDKLLSEAVPSLCWELAQLQDTYILQGDYDLKVMRQEYYMSQQKRFISHLVCQLARHRFLEIACHLERRSMNGAFELLRAIESELDGYTQATIGRIDRCLSLSQAGAEAQEHGAVDDRDTFLHRVRDLLNIYTYEQGAIPIYVSVPGLVQQVNNLQAELQSLQLELDNTEDKAKCISELLTIIRRMQQLLFASSTTAQPILTPWPLMKELADMEKVNSQLSLAIEEVTREHREKAEIVKHHPHEVGREKQVFVNFFCAPDRLRSQVRELAARVKSMQA
ncbi:AUGMIN subunit 3 [Selaginella moellendorffii]|uniref:AUGMIN subunit 3 n=1 Tax=Selaginella moellendorffii TaxID=88036 RepID=UPI000D1D0B71|nr:AUGMIN subunit 3 [Selaginella moellendorffii]|eukprot:XP_024525026.1 AUGMIN subunit 3 [Selaginella moellendorffii]